MSFDLAHLSNAPLVISVGNVLATVALWLRKPGTDAADAVSGLAGRLDVLEERVKHMPTEDDMQEVRDALSDVRERLAAVEAHTGATRAATARIEEFLLKNK